MKIIEKIKISWIAGISLLIILIAGVFYIFGIGTRLSDNHEVFGTFGDYFNPFLTLINILLLGYIAQKTLITTDKFNTNQANYNNIQLRPHLFLQELPSETNYHPLTWQIDLVSEAPAVNVFIRVDTNENNFTKWILCPPLSKTNPTLILSWIRRAMAIEVMYTDITGNQLFGIRVKGRLHSIIKIKWEDFDFELKRYRNNSDFHVGLKDIYEREFPKFPKPKKYTKFIQQNLI